MGCATFSELREQPKFAGSEHHFWIAFERINYLSRAWYLAEKGDTYDNRGYGFRTEYETSFGRVGAFYRTWDDEETNTRLYSTFEAFPGLFSGIIRYQSRIPTKTDASYDVVARYKTQTSGLYFATSREIDDDRSWQYAVSADYQFDKRSIF